MSEETETPGWDAIDAALHPLYGDTEPQHFGTLIKYRLGGPDPLDGISAYKVLAPRPHWHFVTYGFSELYEKEAEDPEVSGYGFELTFRLACAADDVQPPAWALNFLQNLARYVFKTGNVFGAGDHVDLNGPIAAGQDTAIRGILIAREPLLPATRSTLGAFEFLQVVGITLDELRAARDWNGERLCEVLATVSPLLVTDLARRSSLENPAVAEAVHAGIERDGSSFGGVLTPRLAWTRRGEAVEVTIGALAVEGLRRMLRGRIRFGRGFHMQGQGTHVAVKPAETAGWSIGETLQLELTPEVAEEVRTQLEPKRGKYTFSGLPGLTLVVEPTEVQDQDGKVVDVVG